MKSGRSAIGAPEVAKRREFVKAAVLCVTGWSASGQFVRTSLDEGCSMKVSEKRSLTVLTTLRQVLDLGMNLRDLVIKGVNLTTIKSEYWLRTSIASVFFLGCMFDQADSTQILLSKGALIFPKIEGLLYKSL